MKKFLVLYRAPLAEMQAGMANTNPEEQKKSMDEWNKWQETHKDKFVDPGNPVGKTKRIDKSGVTDTHNDIGGYAIVQAESVEEAAALFENSPAVEMTPNSWTEISEIVKM